MPAEGGAPPRDPRWPGQAPTAATGALEALQVDHEFLLKGDVFTKELIDALIEMRLKEYDALRLRPHPIECHMYYDV